MAPKPRPDADKSLPTAPDDASITGARRSGNATVDGSTAEARKDGDGALETYEQEVERASVETLAGHPEGSAPPLERLVDAHPEKQRK